MKLVTLAETSDAVAATRSRLAKVELLAACLRALDADERETAVAWLAGTLPGGPLGLGPAIVHELRGVPPSVDATLTVSTARERLESLAGVRGAGSANRRRDILAGLFADATVREQSFLARLLVGELRQGALERVMADAIAAAAGLAAPDVRRAIMLAGAIAPVAVAALAEGSTGLARFKLRLFEPVGPMLASPTQDVESALAELERAAFEYKLDGARVQVHKVERSVKIYSRTGRDVTFSLPEIEAAVAALDARSLILDGEVIALDATGRPKPFQETMRRFGRKLEVEDARASVPLSLFSFDCLHANGEDLIDRPTEERVAALVRHVPPSLVVPRVVTADLETGERFLRDALDRGHEGLMAKSLTAPYEAGSRGAAWLKIKVAHTLDLVVLAAEWGNGRRRGWLSNLHLGARSDEGFVMLGKTFKGLTDEMLAWQTERLKTLAVDLDAGDYVVNVRPELVVEIAFNELQVSRRYPGGLALRFARVIRYRDDKPASEADTIETVRAIASGQPAAARELPSSE
ncbi:MAG TPA: ATP-dependent DNA ligase [Gammaproteobacteria bacterium]|nr:ATP-dependent DNA ligase [Gammaproteobacteria bacterium]